MFTLPPPEAPPPTLQAPYPGQLLFIPLDEIVPLLYSSFAYRVNNPPVPLSLLV